MAQPNGLNPNVRSISFNAGTFIVTGGLATTTPAIITEIGTPANGSLYISSGGVGQIWVVVSRIWTSLTIN